MKRCLLFALALLLLLPLAAPALAQEEASEPDLRIGSIPVLNMLPLYFAHDAGYFDEEGVAVEITIYQSAEALRSAMVAGEHDGFAADLFSGFRIMEGGVDVRVVRHRRVEDVIFALVAGPGSGLKSVADLAGTRIGISHDTIVQYTSDRMLEKIGMSAAEVEYVEAANILERFQLLLKRQIDAATLPSPYFGLANEFFNAPILIDESGVPGLETFGFRADALADKGDAVRALLRAYERAVETSNADPQLFREVLRDNADLPPQWLMIESSPVFEPAGVPSEADIADAQEWALAAGLIGEVRAYEDIVDGSFLPTVMVEADLRIGGLPAVTMLPLYFAEDAGYFDEAGVAVDLVLYPSVPAARSAALAGELDGLCVGLFGGLWLNDRGADVRVVRHRQLRGASFALVAGPESGIESAADLAGARIGIAPNTIVQYTTDQLLESVGMDAAEVEYVDAASLLERFQMLMRGEIDAATLATPYIGVASEFFAAPVLIDNAALPDTLAILVGAEALAEKGDAVRAFLSAYERAVVAINADPQLFREVLSENVLVPPSLLMLPASPAFESAGVPSEEEIADAIEWALAVGLIAEAQAYEEVVDGSFLPEVMAGGGDMAEDGDNDE